MVSKFDPGSATANELYDYCLTKYRSWNPVSRILIDRYFAKLGRIIARLDARDRLLEVGCGAGESSRRILALLRGQEFEASEFDPRYVARLQETGFPVPVREESVLDLKRADGEFDCVFLLEVLEHVHEYERALSEVFRVSRKFVVISVPNEPLWRVLNVCRGQYLKAWGNPPSHVNHWSPRRIVGLLSRYGTVLQVYRPLPWTIVLVQVASSASP
jgi:SAM-dependent methyltransferase